ncbi:hypothetical protein CMI45_00845 [Candidatus Pacearchaeota archaeon]|nr:hypothetical protein [Candidatus Pacearchaeota archaeon]|tara:strand:+ start:1566 stop:1946 length:381 start_codon:yes stop_codon:yes gene_type:complete
MDNDEGISDDFVRIRFPHNITVSREAFILSAQFFRDRFSQRAGREVPLDDIDLSVSKGDIVRGSTVFRARLEDPLPPHLCYSRDQDGVAFDALIDFLRDYRKGALAENEENLIDYVVEGLDKVRWS